jgi:Tfp pilus assembly protein PilE
MKKGYTTIELVVLVVLGIGLLILSGSAALIFG